MPWVGTRGGEIYKADLDLLATAAEAALDRASDVDAGEMGRTFDVIKGDADPTYVPGTLTGVFSFSDSTETYPDPIGSPVVKTPERWAWCDELNRIWKVLWNIPNNFSFRAGDQYPFRYGDWDLWTGAANGVAWDRIAAYWATQSTPGVGSLDTIVCSPGPNLHTTIKDARPDDSLGGYAKAYRDTLALYSTDQGDFTIYGGLFTSLHVTEYSPAVAYTSGSPKIDTFTYDNIPAGSGLYGYYEVEYTYTGGGAPTDPTASGYDCYFHIPPSGNTGNHDALWDGNKFYMWITDGTSPRGEDTIMYDAAGGLLSTTGTQEIRHYVDATGWVLSKMQFRGGIYTDSVVSGDGSVTGENVIHPRNESVKAALKILTSPELEDADYLLFDTLEQKLSDPGTGTRTVDTNLRAMLRQDTKDALDDYPVPTASDATARAELLTDLNALINGALDNQLYDLWLAAVEATITLRPGTRWMLERDSQDPVFLARMRRLILEDCYSTELRRIPSGYGAPENEILQLSIDIAVTGIADFETTPLFAGSYFCSNQDVEIVYIGLGLPQWCRNTYLDYQMPDGSSHGEEYDVDGQRTSGPRGYCYQWTADQRAWFRPALTPVPSNYPVVHRDWFGVLIEAGNRSERPNWLMDGYVPYWEHDGYHSWAVIEQPPAIAAGGISYNTYDVFINQGDIAAGVEYEYTLDNPNLEIYVSWVDYPDPDDPGTYEFKGERGYYRFPGDFPSSLGIDDGYHSLFVTVKNPTATSQTFREIVSVFSPDGTEAGGDPPNPEPRFFPIQEPNNVQPAAPVGYGDSYRFGPVEGYPTSTARKPFPCPQRGQHIREILIRRLPVRNSAGIYVPPDAADMEEKKIKLGLMAGAGVISGAIYGSYPGNWIDFETIVIPAGENEVRADVSYFVLKGCPLAYYVTTPADGEDDEEFEIFASVEFQPAINNTFIQKTPREEPYITFITGTFSGPPWVSNTYLYGDNLNGYTGLDRDRRSQIVRHGYYPGDVCIVQPPVSNREVKALYDFLLTQ